MTTSGGTMSLVALLKTRGDEIVRRWIGRLAPPAPTIQAKAELGATILANLIRALDAEQPVPTRKWPPGGSAPNDSLSFPIVGDAQGLVHEYMCFRDTVFDMAEESGIQPSLRALRTVLDSLAAEMAEDAIRTTESERELFFRTIPDMLSVASLDGHFLRVNPAYHRVLGWSDEEILSIPFLDLVHPDDREETEREIARLGRGEYTLRFENRYRTKDGRYRRLAWAASPVLEKGVVYAVARDVTERRQTETERENALSLLDSVIETVPVGLAFFDPLLRYTRVNAALARLNGHPPEAHVGRRIREVVPELDDELDPVIRRVFTTGKAEVGLEVSLRRQGTFEDEHQLMAVYPVLDAEGRAFLVGVAVVDITERKRTTQALERAAEFRERFIGIVAHDLRTPIASIVTGAQLLERMEGFPDRASRTARRISSTAQRTAKMIDDLMDFTRIRLGEGIPAERTDVSLTAILKQVVDETGSVYPGRTIHVEAAGDCMGRWDGNRLAQMIGNLLKNALDYSPAESAVRVGLSREAGGVRLEVRNRNKGGAIPPALLRTIFEPFHKSESHGSRGLGLGLYIANEIARAHGGTIDVHSGDAEGTCFTVWLPAT